MMLVCFVVQLLAQKVPLPDCWCSRLVGVRKQSNGDVSLAKGWRKWLIVGTRLKFRNWRKQGMEAWRWGKDKARRMYYWDNLMYELRMCITGKEAAERQGRYRGQGCSPGSHEVIGLLCEHINLRQSCCTFKISVEGEFCPWWWASSSLWHDDL